MALPTGTGLVHAAPYAPSQHAYPYPQPAPQPYAQPFPQQYQQPPHPQSVPNYPAPREHSYGGPGPLTPNGGGQNLRELLANLRQTPQNQSQAHHLPPANGGTPDLGALLSNVARQQNQPHGYPAPQYPQQPSNNQYVPRAPLQPYTNPAGMSAYAGSPGMGASPQGPAQNVQSIMDQLAKWKQ